MKVLLGASSSVGRVRDTNEDSYYVSEQLLVVADGMGGHNAGEVASSMAVRCFVEALRPDTALPDGLVDAFQVTNATVYAGALEPGRKGMGTTLTCAAFRDGAVYVGHVGDSRGYFLRGEHLTPMTVDHSIVGELVRSGSLSVDEAKVHPHRHLVTRALGTAPSVPVDVQVRRLELGDVVLLCSDGLTAVVSDEEIVLAVLAATTLQEASEALVSLTNERGGPDNVTVVLAKLDA